jgi:hypothetical protein
MSATDWVGKNTSVTLKPLGPVVVAGLRGGAIGFG